ncbi:TnsA endonuclease N-terminal domain-containing protein [Pseudomonas sp. GW101-3H06]|uniref:TnsA endonuclease N-terminal domain-containing protein n=1 Tax=Pseudomonas sp. GW101-3H06 TaxID=2751347 RepID=UPI00216B190F|nr:TnsA endonuclease N-terminal domain-containing protein [Pseudomonas sp. GW101-3H06]
MARRRYEIDEAKIQKFLKEGRGRGEGAHYLPWLTIQDVPSSGRSTRALGSTTGRTHHLLSDLETGLFLILDRSSLVIDIREQFPLPREETQRIAASMGVKHPREPKAGNEIVITTDFLITMRQGSETWLVARSVKPAGELEKKRVLEKQEIERRYWSSQSVSFGIVTENEIPKELVKNLRFLSEMRSLNGLIVPYEGYWADRESVFVSQFQQTSNCTLKEFFNYLEVEHGFQVGEALTVFRYLAANKVISFDLNKEWHVHLPIEHFVIDRCEYAAGAIANVIRQ